MASDTTAVRATAFLLFVGAAIYFRPRRQRNPPGPKPLPLIGNILDFPHDTPEYVYDQWKEKYGDIIYMNVLGTPMVILNSLQACNELFDKRSVKYSSRPRQPMLGELMGWIATFVMMPYSERWRKHRRLFHQNFNENMSLTHRPIQQQGTYALLQRLYREPEHLFEHLRLLFGEVITEVMYGLKVTGPDDVLLTQPEAAFETIQAAAVPGKFLVDVLPALKYVPSWFPGAGFKRQAAEWFKLRQTTFDTPFLRVKERMNSGTAQPCVVTSMLSMCEDEEFKGEWPHEGETAEEAIKGCAANAYLAGADTTLSSMQAFFLVMANYPEVQKAAQAELDQVLGDSRLPTFEDVGDLPFIKAIVRELLRWHSATPLGVPHCLSEDDEYNGYMLRKGTIVLGNTWSFSHDPNVYQDPLKFNPWRWTINTPSGLQINESIPDTSQAAFGFGRRICPGRHFAQNALLITIASVLTCFNISPLDSDGKPTDRLDEEFSSGQIRYPKPYKVSITPRSDKVEKLIRDVDV